MLKQLIDIQCYNMKTKKLKRVPQYAFGADAISNWGNMSGVDKANVVTQGVSAVGSMIGNATSGKKPTAAGVLDADQVRGHERPCLLDEYPVRAADLRPGLGRAYPV